MTTLVHQGMPCDPLTVDQDQAEPAARTLPRWAGWIPVAIVVLVVVAAVAWKVVTR